MIQIPYRFVVALLLFLAEALCYLDRISIAIAIVQLRLEGWDEERLGIVMASFFWGYALSQVPAGLASAKWGGHVVVCVALAGWGAMTLALPLVDSIWWMLLCSRVLLGLFEGCIFPAVYAIIARWAVLAEKTRFNAFITSGQEIGTIVALGISPWLVEALTWRGLFYLYGGITLAFGPLLFAFCASSPEQSRFLKQEECTYIVAHRAPYVEISAQSVPWRAFFTNRAFLALCYTHCAFNLSWYVFLGYLPSIFALAGVEPARLGLYSAPPYICLVLCGNGSAVLADWIMNRRIVSTTAVRRIFQAVGFLGPAVVSTVLAFVGVESFTPIWLAVMFSLSMTLASFSRSGFWPNHHDIGGLYAGQLMSITNSFAALAPMIVPPLIGRWLAGGHKWDQVFLFLAISNVVATVVFSLGSSGELQFHAAREEEEVELQPSLETSIDAEAQLE